MSQTANPTMMTTTTTAPPADLPTNTRMTWIYRMGRGLLRFIGVMVFRLRTRGQRGIPPRGGVLIVANHQSYLDPAALGVNVRRPLSFLAKSELFENKFFSAMIRAVNAFPVRQGDGDVGAVREAIKRLQEGHVLLMFPEGARTEDGEVMKLEGGIALIVRRAGPLVRVVPAAIYGAYEAWPKHRTLPRPGRVRVKYGEPLDLSDRKGAEIVKIVEGRIRELFEELRAQAKAEDGR